MRNAPIANTTEEIDEKARVLLEVVAKLAKESRGDKGAAPPVSLDTTLDRELGLDSLGRTELHLRIERAFDVSLPDDTLLADTVRDLLRAVLTASGVERTITAAPLRYETPKATESAPVRARTLPEALDWHVAAHPERIHIHLFEHDAQGDAITYADLKRRALAIAGGLRELGLQPGQTVAIMLPTGREYFYTFFGILLAGAIPVPIYPPARPSQIGEHLRRHRGILGNAQTSILVTVPEAKAVARLLQSQVAELRHVLTASALLEANHEWSGHRGRETELALLQYTSGSTGAPKGVALTHANLLSNIRSMVQRMQAQSTDVFVSWLPLYHDMGLIGAWLGSLYCACPLVVMSPLSFLARPSRWLWAIHRYRGTLSASPNFGYELCLHKIEDSELEGLDLSTWRQAFNGAEPVSPETVVQFGRRFTRYGFEPKASTPVYGLAESSVGLAIPPPGQGAVIDRIRRDEFERSGKALPTSEDDPNPLRFPSCGPPLMGEQIRIVDTDGRELPERQEGRLEFKGPSSTSGYYRNPEATRRLFRGQWLDSGDRAYIARGDIYITGRVKDVIIRAGRNIYPYELDEAIGEIPGIRKGCVAVFGCTDDSQIERLVVVAETRETSGDAKVRLRAAITDRTLDLLGVPADDVLLMPPHTVLKTSSGKIRRAATRELYQRDALGKGRSVVWWQVARLTMTGVLLQLRRFARSGVRVLYAAYAWLVFGIFAVGVWAVVLVLPRLAWRWRAIRAALRLALRLTGIGIIVRGLEHVPDVETCVMVANHASYLDSFVLIAALPRNFSYVAKRELADRFVTRALLGRVDTVFVERFDLPGAADETTRITAALRIGRSLAFFPEGTFDRAPGLLPFHMGAFLATAQTGVSIVPVTIRGTRSILRAGSWFPRRGVVRIIVGPPLRPDGDDWAAAVKLRDATRAKILRHSGDPDVGADTPTLA